MNSWGRLVVGIMLAGFAPTIGAQPRALGVPASGQAASTSQTTIPEDLGASALSQLVAELERSNPELAAGRRDVDMRVARVAPAGALPDPTVRAGYMSGFLRPPFFPSASNPDSFRQFGASQEFPYRGKLALRTRIATTEADAERWNYEATRRRLVAELKALFFEYRFVEQSLAITERNKTLLDQLRKIAEARFAVGKGLQQDVIKAQLEISLLLERTAALGRDRRTLGARINGLLYRPSETPITATASDVSVTVPSLDELRAVALTGNPAIKRDERLIDRGQQTLALAKKELLPDFGVNVTMQRFVGDMSWMYGVDLMVKVPLFWQRKQRPLIAEAAASLERGRQMRESTLSMAMAAIAEEHAAATTSQNLIELYRDSVLPQARLALQSSLAAYQVGSVDFLTLVTNYTAVLEYELRYQEQQARLYQALARLEPPVGIELVR